MTRTIALAATTFVLALAAVACGGSEPEGRPATPPPTEAGTTTEAPTPRPTETEAPAATPATTPTAATPASTPAEPAEPGEEGEVPLEIVTLLPPDAIPAIDNPRLISAEEADKQLRLSDLVIGVSVNGEHRAYGAAFLSGHEIVNDMLGGRAIAVTW